jgi:hypothetical protein
MLFWQSRLIAEVFQLECRCSAGPDQGSDCVAQVSASSIIRCWQYPACDAAEQLMITKFDLHVPCVANVKWYQPIDHLS